MLTLVDSRRECYGDLGEKAEVPKTSGEPKKDEGSVLFAGVYRNICRWLCPWFLSAVKANDDIDVESPQQLRGETREPGRHRWRKAALLPLSGPTRWE